MVNGAWPPDLSPGIGTHSCAVSVVERIHCFFCNLCHLPGTIQQFSFHQEPITAEWT